MPTNIYGWLTANPADIVLLHIGTNALDTSPDDVENILDEIDRYESSTAGNAVTVLLARIINRVAYSVDTTTFNDNVETMASTAHESRTPLAMISSSSIWKTGPGSTMRWTQSPPYDDDDMYDNLHPNDRGYGKMADKWYEHLVSNPAA